jgi:hypothetical protein
MRRFLQSAIIAASMCLLGSRSTSRTNQPGILTRSGSGMRGPVLIKWVRELLSDRDERQAKEKTEEKKTSSG